VGRSAGTDERGFTLIEMVIVVAIVATTVAAGFGVSLASRSFAVSAAATEFDHLLDSARTIAREVQGVTLTFAPDAYGDGTEVRVLAGGPGGALTPTTLPPLHTRATIEETESLHQTPFAFIVHLTGALGGRPGFRFGDATTAAEVGCPPSGAFHFVIRAAGGSADRYVPCRITLASTGPVALETWPGAPTAPLPTPCGGPCAPPTLPSVPASSPSCPPGYAPTNGGCAPTPPPSSGPNYHVSVSLASPTMTVGGTDALTAQATLTNPNAVPAGTPSSIPISVQQVTSAICAASPSGPQPSGSTFVLSGLSAGTCTATIQPDPSGVPGATADSAPISVAISASPVATPRPCDLVTNGKCYQRIVGETNQAFSKFVAPTVACDLADSQACQYVDVIQSIALGAPYTLQAATPPSDAAHELLFKIDKITTVLNECLPFPVIAASTPVNRPIVWPESGIGAPVDAPVGFGEPSIYLTENHVIAGPGAIFQPTLWSHSTTLSELWNAMARHLISPAYMFTFSSAGGSNDIQWFPDFPGCDAVGDPNVQANQFGNVTVVFDFEVYQATP
jgi:prepilin-type N-terminal cleavage/methylation domain-containing protein